MASTDARPVPIKNTAYRVTFPLLDADGDLVTGATGLDSEVSKDAGAFADCTNEATEIATSSGVYYLDLTSTEMNADCVAVIVKTSSSGAKTTVLVFYPQESGDIKVDVQSYGGTAGTFASGRPEVNVTHLLGTAWLTPGTAGTPDVNVKLISGDSTAADNAEAFFDGTGYAGTNNVIPTVTTLTNLPAITSNWLTAAGIAADAGAEIADAVWDEVLSGHLSAGSTGEALNAAGAAGDPWVTALPGAYGVGSAGYIVGTNLNATVSSRASQTSVDDVPTVAEFEARTVTSATYATAANLATVAGYLDTEIAAILEDTGTTLPAQIAALNNLSAAQVRTELSTELARIDVATSTRMATYTQPTGFLAATFPTTVASPTNITAGTITTVTTLTNLPAITSNWLTAAGIAADAGTEIAAAVLAAGDIDGYTLEEAQKLQLAALVGEVSGAATTTVVIRAADDSKARITATVTADGDRTALTLDETG